MKDFNIHQLKYLKISLEIFEKEKFIKIIKRVLNEKY